MRWGGGQQEAGVLGPGASGEVASRRSELSLLKHLFCGLEALLVGEAIELLVGGAAERDASLTGASSAKKRRMDV